MGGWGSWQCGWWPWLYPCTVRARWGSGSRSCMEGRDPYLPIMATGFVHKVLLPPGNHKLDVLPSSPPRLPSSSPNYTIQVQIVPTSLGDYFSKATKLKTQHPFSVYFHSSGSLGFSVLLEVSQPGRKAGGPE